MNDVNEVPHTVDYDALLKTVLDLCDEWDTAIEPDGSTSFAPVRGMSSELRARVTSVISSARRDDLAERVARVEAVENARAAGVNEGIRLAAQLVRDHTFSEAGERVADFLIDRADRAALTSDRAATEGGGERG